MRFQILLIVLLITSCKSRIIERKINRDLDSDAYTNQFTGLFIIDPEKQDTIYSYNSEKFFTPASNTKIFTLFAATKYLADSIPAIKYHAQEDLISILGTGDPTFLHPYFKDSTLLKLVNRFKIIDVYDTNLKDDKYGPGWAWEDFDSYFNPERSALPIFGNTLQIYNHEKLFVYPEALKDSVVISTNKYHRASNKNIFYIPLEYKDTLAVPIILNSETRQLLWNSISHGKTMNFKTHLSDIPWDVAYGVPTDSLLQRMMFISDNFLAEQILLLCSSTKSNFLDSDAVRKEMLDTYLSDIAHKPRWVDGSGLSRYNLFTPQSIVHVLSKLYSTIPKERLFNLFPTGGRSGTIKNNYEADSPYVFAKSGSLGNNYCLSGYLITKSKRTLIFSFMNNHYTRSTNSVKSDIQNVLEYFRDAY